MNPLLAAEAVEISLWGDPIEFMRTLTFQHPGHLWWLVALVGMLAVYILLQFRRRTFAVRFTNVALLDKVAPERLRWRKHIPPVLFLMGMAFGILTWAEAQHVVAVPTERATVVMAIDTSLSMQANDVTPSRIEGAKIAAADFVDQLPPEINLGLVSYNGIATIRISPGKNRQAVKAVIADLQLGAATATGEAIFASLQAIGDILPDDTGPAPPARIVLMSDGKRTVGREDAEAIEAARQAGVPVSTIAFGTESGTITLPEYPGELVPVPVDYAALRLIAEGTGGQFFTAASTDELREVYADIGSSIGFDEETKPVIGPFIATALLLLGLAWFLSLAWRVTLPS